MTKATKRYDLNSIVAGRSVHSWDQKWTFVERGFLKNHPELNYEYGIFAAKIGTNFAYIGTAASVKQGGRGLNKALSRPRIINNKGDFGMLKLKAIVDVLDAYIITMPRDYVKTGAAHSLANAMRQIHCPSLNATPEVISIIQQGHYQKNA